MKGFTVVRGFAFVAVLALVLPTQALSQETTKAGVVTTLQGTASVARTSAKESRPLKFKDNIFVQDRITTGEDSIVRILLGGKAGVTVRERSVLTISETPTTATVEVGSGKVAVAVAKERMRAGDSVEVKTPNAVAGIRGTVLIAEVSQDSASRANTQFTLLTGIVDVSGLDAATGRSTGPRVTMQPLQTLGVAGFTRPSAPRNISRADAQAVASAYKVTVPTPTPAANAPMVERQVEQGVAAAAALVPVDPKVKADPKAEAKVDTKVDPKADPKAAPDGPAQDVAVDDGKSDKSRQDDSGQSAKDRKASAPGNSGGSSGGTTGGNSGGTTGGTTGGPGATSGPAPSASGPTAAAPPPAAPAAPTAPASSGPAPAAPAPPAVNPPAAASPPPAVPPVASGPGNDKKPGLLDDLTKKLPKLPKPPKPR
jgi:hypothetical protein